MSRLLFAFCVATAALAAPIAAQESRALIWLPGWIEKFPIEDVTVPFTLDAPLAKSYDAVKAAFADLKVPTVVDDPHNWIVGNQAINAQLSFAGYRGSRILDCGERSATGQNADSFRLTIVFLALLDPVDSTHTKLRVGFAAGAIPPSGTRSDGVTCGSKGVLEARLDALAAAHLK